MVLAETSQCLLQTARNREAGFRMRLAGVVAHAYNLSSGGGGRRSSRPFKAEESPPVSSAVSKNRGKQ